VKYQTTLRTLRSVPGSRLETTFREDTSGDLFELSKRFGFYSEERGGFSIDRNGPAFAHVLQFLRTRTVPSWSLPLEEAEVLRQEAAYYGLAELEAWAMERLRDRRITVQGLKGWLNIALNGGGTVDLANMDGSCLDLSGFSFGCSVWAPGVSFQNANLANASIDNRYSIFRDAIFVGTNLEGASMVGNFGGARFSGANLRGAIFSFRSFFDDLSGADLRGATFQGCIFSQSTSFNGANMEGTRFFECYVLDQSPLQRTPGYNNKKVKRINVKAWDFQKTSMSLDSKGVFVKCVSVESPERAINAMLRTEDQSFRLQMTTLEETHITGAINLDRAVLGRSNSTYPVDVVLRCQER